MSVYIIGFLVWSALTFWMGYYSGSVNEMKKMVKLFGVLNDSDDSDDPERIFIDLVNEYGKEKVTRAVEEVLKKENLLT
jgi:hypothetical protein